MNRLRGAFDLLPTAAFATWAVFWAASGTFTDPPSTPFPATNEIRYDQQAGTASIPMYEAPLLGSPVLHSTVTLGCANHNTAVRSDTFANGAPTEVHHWATSKACKDLIIGPGDFNLG